MVSHILTARSTAWKTLNQCHIYKHDTADVLNRLLTHTDRPAQATDIVFGVIRNRGTLDHILKTCSVVDPKRIKPKQWNLLRIGVYELVYAPDTADYAIVNEAVQLARDESSQKTAGFVNAVLRNVQRAIEKRQAVPNAKYIRRTVPQTPETGCLFNSDVMPDPIKESVSYFSVAFSIPQLLVRQWLEPFGKEQTQAICLASNRHPSVILQPNTLYTTLEDLKQKLDEEGVEAECSHDQLRIRSVGKINQLKSYLEGLFYVQDTTASEAINAFSPTSERTVVDLCAAPGGKCAAAAIQMKDKGLIVASDIDAKRLAKVRENAKRLRLQSIEVVPAARLEQMVRKLDRVDAIMLDVPCSNTGVLARRAEARWRWKPDAVLNLCGIQRELLNKAAILARPQTKILYSTCSIQPEENNDQIRAFLSKNKHFSLLTEKLTLPTVETADTFDYDGGYVAVLQPK